MAGQREIAGVEFDDAGYIARLNRQLKSLKGATENDVRATGVYVVNKAKGFAAVRTGFMRSNITYEEGTDGKGFFVKILCRANYWASVEFGHVTASGSFVQAQPFMRPAFVLGKEFLIKRVRGRA